MRRATALVGGLLAAGLAALVWPAPAASAGGVVTGSWTQLRTTTPVGESPDLQSTDGHELPVSNAVLGPVAIAALRFPVAATTLELTRVDPASVVPTSALPGLPVPPTVVWACPARTPWQAGDRQPWTGRPTYDCGTHAVGQPTAAGMFWDLSGIADTGVDVVLVPAPGDTTAYSLTFAPPTPASFQTAEVLTTPPVDPPQVASDAPAVAVPPIGTVSVPAGALPTGPVKSGSAAPAPVSLPAPQVGAPQQATAPVAATSTAPRWVGPALLAFLAFLLMAKAALPAAAAGAPRPLVAVHNHRESS